MTRVLSGIEPDSPLIFFSIAFNVKVLQFKDPRNKYWEIKRYTVETQNKMVIEAKISSRNQNRRQKPKKTININERDEGNFIVTMVVTQQKLLKFLKKSSYTKLKLLQIGKVYHDNSLTSFRQTKLTIIMSQKYCNICKIKKDTIHMIVKTKLNGKLQSSREKKEEILNHQTKENLPTIEKPARFNKQGTTKKSSRTLEHITNNINILLNSNNSNYKFDGMGTFEGTINEGLLTL
ncbi:hypothetical protein H8356DRAFT_1423756 [Neocallimastix lanati (nom. inval.)]|nr:hypothetical protein H8356DRAFT_1423756 [Neocallimastix sp. JGI-2020a]